MTACITLSDRLCHTVGAATEDARLACIVCILRNDHAQLAGRSVGGNIWKCCVTRMQLLQSILIISSFI